MEKWTQNFAEELKKTEYSYLDVVKFRYELLRRGQPPENFEWFESGEGFQKVIVSCVSLPGEPPEIQERLQLMVSIQIMLWLLSKKESDPDNYSRFADQGAWMVEALDSFRAVPFDKN